MITMKMNKNLKFKIRMLYQPCLQDFDPHLIKAFIVQKKMTVLILSR